MSRTYRQKFFDRLAYIYEHGKNDPLSKRYMLLLRGQYNLKKFGMLPEEYLRVIQWTDGSQEGARENEVTGY